MNKLIMSKNNKTDTIKQFFKFLLDNDKVSGIFSLRTHNGVVDYCLLTDASQLDEINPFYPVMPVNGGQLLSRFTQMDKPIAAVIRPCELRAFIELVKREQSSLDNILCITYSCSGVFSLQENALGNAEKSLTKYWDSVQNAEIFDEIRPTCKVCENIKPLNSDIYIPVIGENEEQCKMYLNTDKAVKLSEKFECELSDSAFDSKIIDAIIEKRNIEKKKFYSEIKSNTKNLDDMIDIFGKCIGCHGCSRICPICYCTLCDFESYNFDYNSSILEKELAQKGAIRLPPDTLFFHLGRLSHMSFSCVGCGQCTDVCPADIPVASIFKKIGEETASMFDFEPGRNVDEQIPVMIYKEEEFPELGE